MRVDPAVRCFFVVLALFGRAPRTILTPMLDTLQAFLAFNLDVGAIRRVAAVQRVLRALPGVKSSPAVWATPTNLHVAVRVLGEIDRAAVSAWTDAMRRTAEGLVGNRLALGPVEALPSADAARLLVVRVVDGVTPLQQAAVRIEQAAEQFGLPARTDKFHPLLVIGRIPTPVDVTSWLAAGAQAGGEARVTEVVLYTNELRRPGAEYTALGRVPVSGTASMRTQRPSRVPKPSQRPRSRSKPPAAGEVPPPQVQIPKPPRLPSVSGPGGGDGERGQVPSPAEAPSPPGSARLPAALEAKLPNEEEWK